MDLYSVLDAGRSHYLRFYRSALAQYRQRYNPSAPELWIEPNGSKNPAPYSYYRLDLASGAVSPPDLREVNVDPHAVIEPCTFRPAARMHVSLSTFVWNGIEVRSITVPEDPLCITGWVEKWFDVSESRSPDEEGLAGIIHSVTYPKVGASGWSFAVDFGSAPMDAVRELMLVLSEAGLTELEMGSFYLQESH
jgi:hypothetical protein